MNVLAFDIETVPDTAYGRRWYQLPADMPDDQVGQAMFALQRAKTGSDFLPHYLQRVVAISVLLASERGIKLWSLGAPEDSEDVLLERFWVGLSKYQPVLVSWNGQGFDLPVLHFRTLQHKLQAPVYWEAGERDSTFKWNNYLNRFHARHIDIMDVLSGYQNRAFAPLDAIATQLGLPGKQGMSGSKVFDSYLAGDIENIRNYCESDVINTYLVYLRFEWMRGNLSLERFQALYEEIIALLEAPEAPEHLQAFAKAWSTEQRAIYRV